MTWPWASAETWTLPVFFLGFGGLFLLLAFLLLTEYRKLFFADPKAAMSFEVLSQLLELGAPGYLGALGLVTGTFFFVIGAMITVALIVVPVVEILRQLVYAIGLNFK